MFVNNYYKKIAVGKSCLVSRYAEGRYREVYEPTIGVEFASKILEININKKKFLVKT